VANGKGVGVAHFYTGPPTAAAFNPVTRQWAIPDSRKWETYALAGAGVHSSTAEAIALKAGLLKLTKQLLPAPLNRSLIIATDCRSLVLALEKGPIKLKDPTIAHIWRSLYKLFDRGIARIAIQWVPSHCGIPRNEFADARAKTLLLNGNPILMRKVPMLYSTAVSYYKEQNRQYYHGLLTAEETDRLVITNTKANLRTEDKLTRTQQSTLAQLRSGTCTSMGWYVGYCRSGYDPDHKNDLCRWCGVAPESVLHVFNDCEDLQISLLRAEYHTATNKTFSANTLCSDQLAALEFHAAAVRVLGVRGGGL
jgi:ribonuclease HI